MNGTHYPFILVSMLVVVTLACLMTYLPQYWWLIAIPSYIGLGIKIFLQLPETYETHYRNIWEENYGNMIPFQGKIAVENVNC